MSYRVSKDSSIPINASTQESEELLDVEADDVKSWVGRVLLTLTTTPSDWHLGLNEWIQTIDWDAKAHSCAEPLGNGLTVVFYVIRFLQENLIKPESYKIASKQDAFDLSRSNKLREYDFLSRYSFDKSSPSSNSFYASFLSALAKFLDVVIILILLVNVVISYKYFWGYFKTYSLFNLRERPASKHVTKRSLTSLNDDYLENVYNGSLWSMIRYFVVRGSKGDEKIEETETYYSLEKWMPSKFSTHFFASFSPTCLMFLLFSDISFTTAFPVILHQIVLHYLIIDRFEERSNDEMVIHQALMAEYESKVVRPLTGKRVQDVQIDATPYGGGFVHFLPAVSSSKSLNFKTHSLMGDTILEKFNPATQEFEDVVDSGDSHNVVVQASQFYSNCPHRNLAPRQHFDTRTISCQLNDHLNQSRRATPPGFYTPCLSSTSGMSSSFHGEEGPIAYYGPGSTHCQTNSPMAQNPKKKSISPLRRSISLKGRSGCSNAGDNRQSDKDHM